MTGKYTYNNQKRELITKEVKAMLGKASMKNSKQYYPIVLSRQPSTPKYTKGTSEL